jgi:16S rRNA (adenine1518-N6/adenine1519-N6)-dimethyltransferase
MTKLTSPAEIKVLLERYNFSFSKSLGQNFLIDENIVRKIIDEADVDMKNVLEIGPGIGTLTTELSKRAKKVLAVEVDLSLKEILSENLSDCENVEVVFEDFLDFDIKKASEEYFSGEEFKVVANLPYYITTPILEKLLESDANISEIVVMMQKEVANRIVSKPNNKEYGSITVFIKYFGEAKILMNIPKTVFMPKPKIDSSMVKIEILNKDKTLLKPFESVLRAAFQMRRKTILNALSNGLKIDKEKIREIFRHSGINENDRAENLDIDDYMKITKLLCEEGFYDC